MIRTFIKRIVIEVLKERGIFKGRIDVKYCDTCGTLANSRYMQEVNEFGKPKDYCTVHKKPYHSVTLDESDQKIQYWAYCDDPNVYCGFSTQLVNKFGKPIKKK